MDYSDQPAEITGIFPGDIIIKQMISLAIDDIRKNPWIVEDIFRSLIENPLLKDKYGLKEVTRAKEFILNNEINYFMSLRLDKEIFPCITIDIGSSNEDDNLATLGDQTPFVEDLTPEEIGQPIKYIIQPFDIVSYDKTTGLVEIPADIEDYQYIDTGMVAVDPETGNGFIIQGKGGVNGFLIEIGSNLPKGKLGIIPQYQLYQARRERAISQETYTIGMHVHGDPSTLIFLFSIVKYALYRYREALLEHENFQLSRLSCSPMSKNQIFQTENVFSRFITLRGQVEESWVKTPYRFIEAIDLGKVETLDTGIKIISNKNSPAELDTEDDVWVTIEEE